jgi:saccharopine dehydrogenase (NAD+, L-lysine forming)
VNVEHEEVLLVLRYLTDLRRVTFKYALGGNFIEKLQFLHDIGLDRVEPVRVRGVDVSRRDVVAAVVPDPITMGDKMVGRAIVGTWVIGSKDGKPREVFLYQMADAAETLRTTGSQVVGWQTGFIPTLRCWTDTASITRWSRWSLGRIARPEV